MSMNPEDQSNVPPIQPLVFSPCRRIVDAIIVDDRFLNQHPNFDNNGASMSVFSTLDLIDALVSTGSKTSEERLDYRTQLRQAGYILVPVSEDETVTSSQ